jgi:hypothetical protein
MSSVQGATSANNAIQQWQYLQSLLSTGSATSSQPTDTSSPPAQAFDPFAGLGGAPPAPASGGPTPPFNLDNMSALIDAQAQSSGTASGLSQRQQKVFGELDTDGDGSVTKAELEKDFGADNKAVADYVMQKLDTDGDGSISKSEFAAGTTRGGHHHMHAGPPQGQNGQDPFAALFGQAQGANSTSTSNSDGSSTTTISYADGSKVSMTSAASTNSDNSANTNTSSSAKSNLLEQLIKLQAALTQGASSTSVATA